MNIITGLLAFITDFLTMSSLSMFIVLPCIVFFTYMALFRQHFASLYKLRLPPHVEGAIASNPVLSKLF
ncbi:hypothetical protein FGO68_gene6031 [Halteria grandinella]|uniref:Uncharacterized protein n=1 Tax=Halteria grandinella TaxID=5974 RepID=A0A8J8P1G1_HALGN|nr:hypothetical protein FGO68_gene6031 [Halteria grandinella]